MSLYGAMMTGISGLDANSQAMSIYSSNIANVNTVGYKDVEANFEDLLTSQFGNPDNASVLASGEQNVTQQGLLQSASSPTDLAISGNGFFVVNQTASDTGQQYFTRAGNFTPDSNGNLENSSGYYLMGWPVGADGSVPTNADSLVPVNVSNLAGKAEATTAVTLQANLQATSTQDPNYQIGDMSGTPPTATPDFSTTVNVYDSQGGTEPLTYNFIQTAPNSWSYEVDYNGSEAIDSPDSQQPNLIAAGTLTFNTDGSLAGVTNYNFATATQVAGTNMSFTIPFDLANSGLAQQPLAVNVGTIGSTNGVTQFNSPSDLVNSSVNGALFGNLTGVTVGSNGFVTANFSNGLSENIYQIPLATFANEDGLASVSGDAYEASSQSGNVIINAPNVGGSGEIQSSELEGSTVDLATEFTNLITTQRAYSASARIVTTADQMLQTLEQLPSS
ncbi:MAG: flagellar hook protein FlgE [Rhizomicrobium sp.]|jgi:flagellar hook protein FlgE